MKYLATTLAVIVSVVIWVVISHSAFAYTFVSVNISSDTTWHTGEVYVVYGPITISSGVTLTIEPGAVIKFYDSSSLTVSGSLFANGISGNKIYFTSIKDDTVGGDTNGDSLATSPAVGDWVQISVVDGGVFNLNYSVVRFGGVWPSYTNIYQSGGTLNVANSVIENSATGIRMAGGASTIENSIFRGNSLGMESTGPGSLTLNNNIFTNNINDAVDIYFNDNKFFASSGNTAFGNAKNGFFIWGFIQTDQTWTDQMPYIISGGGITVLPGNTLTINPGTEIKFDYGGFMTLSGEMDVNGTADNEVYFTSIKDDSVGGDTNNNGPSSGAMGDWGQITINPGVNVNINHAVVSFGGGVWPRYSNIVISGGSLNMSNSIVSSGSTGLRIYRGWANIANSIITDNHDGISIEGNGGMSISNSSIYGNSEYGIYNGTFSEINAENNWWGDASGPYNFFNNNDGQGDRISTFIDFDPWLTAPPVFDDPPVLTREPVIIVPGILGSRLNRVSDGEEVWPRISLMGIPGPDNYLDELKLDQNGDEILDINSSEIIESVLFLNQYGNLIQKFKDNGYELEKDLFVIPYDWRLNIETSSHELDSQINQAIANSLTGKVNVVAHSMGGLLVKDYLMRNGESGINKVIFAGTPHLGAPKAFNLLNWGDDFDLKFLGLGLNKNKAKDIAQNMPSAYELLPSHGYLNRAGPYVKDNNGINLNYVDTNQLMTSSQLLVDHRNSALLTRANQFHQSHDDWLPQSADVYNLLGCREYDTIGSFIMGDDGSVDINSINGDGTVPLISAEHIPGNNYFVSYPQTKINHMGLVSDARTIEIIYDIVNDSPPVLPNGISADDNQCNQSLINFKRLRFSTHSPVNLHVYDGLGNHTGLTPEGNIELGIPDSNFTQVGDNTFIFVPDNAQYSIKIDAYATGNFDFKVKELENGEVINSSVYENIPIDNPNLEANFQFSDISNINSLEVDREGDGVVDLGYLPDGSWIPYSATIQSTIADLERVYILGWTNGIVKNSLQSLLNVSLPTSDTIQSKGKKANGVLGTAFLKQLETEYNKGSINEKAFNIIKTDILWLLGN